jgi:type VI secretion system VasD/TssJ family lipoprotein
MKTDLPKRYLQPPAQARADDRAPLLNIPDLDADEVHVPDGEEGKKRPSRVRRLAPNGPTSFGVVTSPPPDSGSWPSVRDAASASSPAIASLHAGTIRSAGSEVLVRPSMPPSNGPRVWISHAKGEAYQVGPETKLGIFAAAFRTLDPQIRLRVFAGILGALATDDRNLFLLGASKALGAFHKYKGLAAQQTELLISREALPSGVGTAVWDEATRTLDEPARFRVYEKVIEYVDAQSRDRVYASLGGGKATARLVYSGRSAPSGADCASTITLKVISFVALNPGEDRVSLPVGIRLFQLNARPDMAKARPDDLFHSKPDYFRGALLSMHEMTLAPGESWSTRLERHKGASFLVAAAMFARAEGSNWYVVYDLPCSLDRLLLIAGGGRLED